MKKISDFFKTPEKNVEHKQKSLLQFFSKNKVETNEEGTGEVSVVEELLLVSQNESEAIVLTPTSSDKENTDVVAADIADDSLVQKSKVEEITCNGHVEKLVPDKTLKSSCSENNDLEHKKRGKKEKKRAGKEVKKGNTDQPIVEKEQSFSNFDNRNENDSKSEIIKQSQNVKENNQLIPQISKEVHSNEFICAEGSAKVSEGNKTKKKLNLDKDDSVMCGLKSSSLSLPTLNGDNLVDDKTKLGKKNSLHVKEMMDILKEIKDSEKESKKKKKHNKKHKRKVNDTQESSKVTHEISCSNSPETLESKAVEKNIEGESDNTNNAVKYDKHADVKSVPENGRDERIPTSVASTKKCKTRKKNDFDKFKKKTQKCAKGTSENCSLPETVPNDLQLPNENRSICGKSVKEETEVLEMSYTEYLEKLEKSMSENQSDGDEVIVLNDSVEVDIEVKEVKIDVKGDGETKCFTEIKQTTTEKSSIKGFFAPLTSTPDKPERKKNATQRKTKESKDKTKAKGIDLQVKGKQRSSSNIDVEVMEDVTVSVTEKKISSTPGKKSQQTTLSFGKAGLTLSKQVSCNENSDKKELETNVLDDQDKPTVKRRGKGRRPKTPKNAKDADTESEKKGSEVSMSDNDVFATPVVKKGNKRKVDEVVEDTGDENEERRRSGRKRYKVEAFQMDADKKTPIKIKLKR